jgi:hypothetical protein
MTDQYRAWGFWHHLNKARDHESLVIRRCDMIADAGRANNLEIVRRQLDMAIADRDATFAHRSNAIGFASA